jgi:hypothetical protein
MFGMVLSMTWLEFKDMAQDPLVRREPVSGDTKIQPLPQGTSSQLSLMMDAQ